MKIYFSASRYFKDDFEKNYEKIVGILKKGSSAVYDGSRSKLVPMGFEMPNEEKSSIYEELVKMMDKSDICVFEASYPSTLHIGHEITLAMEKNKPVVVLHLKGREPILFKGMKTDKVIWIEYVGDDVEQKLVDAIEESKKNIDVRFNFFVSPKILSYLDWVAQQRREPKSVFLRELIEKEMKKDREFKG